MERLLSAAETCIVEVGFERATIAEIAKRADSSVGAFYARFSDKDALLRCLTDRFIFEAKATMDLALRPEVWGDKTVQELCEGLLGFMSEVLEQRRLFIVALSKATMSDPALAEFRGALSMHAAAGLSALVAARDIAMDEKELSKLMRVVSWVSLAVLEINCVQGSASLGGITSEVCIHELSEMVAAYLDLESKVKR